MKLLEFRKLRTSDRYEEKFEAWSRIYEYPLVLDMIAKYKPGSDVSIHNSSWGFAECHITFKDALESRYSNVTNTDLRPSDLPNTGVWDITKEPTPEFAARFDVVTNVSTVEEVKFNHMTIFENLFARLNPGGILILTFDLPGLQLRKFERLFAQKITPFSDELNGATSAIPNRKYKRLSCGLMVVENS